MNNNTSGPAQPAVTPPLSAAGSPSISPAARTVLYVLAAVAVLAVAVPALVALVVSLVP